MTDREEVIEELKKVWNAFNAMEHELYADYVFDALELLLKEQKHGHWGLVEGYYDDEQHWQCSCCGEEWYLEAGNPTDNEMYYCPRCGAIMDEKVMQDGIQ